MKISQKVLSETVINHHSRLSDLIAAIAAWDQGGRAGDLGDSVVESAEGAMGVLKTCPPVDDLIRKYLAMPPDERVCSFILHDQDGPDIGEPHSLPDANDKNCAYRLLFWFSAASE